MSRGVRFIVVVALAAAAWDGVINGAAAGTATAAVPKARPQVIEPIPGVQAGTAQPAASVTDGTAHAPSLTQVKRELRLQRAASEAAMEYGWGAQPYQASGPVASAHINPDGTATPPASAPPAVKAVIAAANQIIDKPYLYAGGHSGWIAPGYDCSGAVSYALHGGGLLSAPLAVQFEGYGLPGPGRWISVYADSEHVFAAIAGLAFDTANFGGPNIPAGSGPRWRYDPTGNLADGGNYVVRHPAGL